MALAACGDDEDEAETQRQPTETGVTVTAPPGETAAITATQTETAPAEPPATSPEDQPGGAGDEVPARSEAMLTGSGGRITPRIVLVPPFIAVRVELRSADARPYVLTAGGRTLRADEEVSSASTTFDGLRPGRRIILTGTGDRVVIEASAEPGP